MSYRLGVDLGTTFTAAASLTGDRVAMLDFGNRAVQVPSVVFITSDGSVLVGEAAERRAPTSRVGSPGNSSAGSVTTSRSF